MHLIVFDLLFQMQEKSRRSISKKVCITRFLKIIKIDQPGRYTKLFFNQNLVLPDYGFDKKERYYNTLTK